MKPSAELIKFTETCVKMKNKDFNFFFNKGDISPRSVSLILARLSGIGLNVEFFETEEDCFSWIEEVISARKNTDLSLSTLESDDAPLRDERTSKAKAELAKLKEEEEQQRKVTDTTKKNTVILPNTPASQDKKILDPAIELGKLKEQFLKMKNDEFDYYFKSPETLIHSSGVSIERRLAKAGVRGEFFKTQKDYNAWRDEIIFTKKLYNLSTNIDKILNEFEEKIKDIGLHYPDAKIKANELLESLRKNKNEAFSNPSLESIYDFADTAKRMIESTIPFLQKDLESEGYLQNLSKQLLNSINIFIKSISNLGSSNQSGFFAVKSSHAAKQAFELGRDLDNELKDFKP
ncbi:hypothetical protein [Legionella pneumophila]|uniref:hypothetical protein n=1 Tax=Legionella pneumophila TaxID=446 RepID=UPI000D066E74|nr:hypothetical protein [Legionella pneumophila]